MKIEWTENKSQVSAEDVNELKKNVGLVTNQPSRLISRYELGMAFTLLANIEGYSKTAG